ncbi:hypothetical protein T4D_218 [Trichinella pseudospiralis]|uniref:Uncharacterized protein n=1 Tax=Trichinella pseudospiralis TaxID=6337 RepID=A0A0V1FXC0_TRIPS|nr:hypothetical protein T4D_218 [Trichinella pseudospiralis]
MYNQCQWGLKKRGIIYCFKLAGSVSNPIFEVSLADVLLHKFYAFVKNKIKEHKLPFFKNLSTVHISECDVILIIIPAFPNLSQYDTVKLYIRHLILYESILNNLELDFFGVILVNE